LDGARTGGCSHLLVVAGEHKGCRLLLVVAIELGIWSFPQVVARESRWLEPPSSCSWKTKEVGASNECNSSRHVRKNIMWFSPSLGFHVKKIGGRQQKSFDTLKEKIITTPVLDLPDLQQSFQIETDVNAYSMG
jgi:hypothetical protein